MLYESLESICSLLLSTKIRDRNDALERLQDINFGLPSTIETIDAQLLLRLLNSLDVFINSDKILYEKSNTNTIVEARLNKAGSILRKLITNVWGNSKFVFLYKPRQSEKLVDILLRHLVYQPAESDLRLFDPVVLNISKTLSNILKQQCFRDHMFSATYELVLNKTIKCLNMVLSSTKSSPKNENLIIELFVLLYTFVNPEHTSDLLILSSSTQYYSKIFTACLIYFKNVFSDTKRERESAICVLRIINKCLVSLSTQDIKLCHQFYKLGTQYILEVKTITSLRLVSEMSIFINLIPSFIALHSLPRLTGDNWEFNRYGEMNKTVSSRFIKSDRTESSVIMSTAVHASSEADESVVLSDSQLSNDEINEPKKRRRFSEDYSSDESLTILGNLIETVFNLVNDNSFHKQLELSEQSVHVNTLAEQESKLNVFNFKYYFLTKGYSSTPWLLRLGISKLIIAYYELKGQMGDNSATTKANKIQRASTPRSGSLLQLTDYLSYFDTSASFFASVIKDDPFQGNLNMSSLNEIFLLYLGYISSFDNLGINKKLCLELVDDCKNILSALINVFERNNKSMKYWSFLSIIVFHSLTFYEETKHDTDNSELTLTESFQRLIKYSLEFLKDSSLSKLSCIFLSQISIYYFTNESASLFLSKALIQQYENLIELSEINGPSTISTESIIFWIATSTLCKNFKLSKFHSALGDNDDNLYSHKVSKWFLGKFDQIKNLTSHREIYFTTVFVAWMSGMQSTIDYKALSGFNQYYAGNKTMFFLSNTQRLELSKYILQSEYIGGIGNLLDPDYIFTAESMSINDKTKMKLKTVFYEFIESLGQITRDSSRIIWSLAIQNILASNEDVYVSLSRNCNNILKNNLRNFHGDEQLNTLLHQYYDCFLYFPDKRTLDKECIFPAAELSDLSLYMLNNTTAVNLLHTKDVDMFDSFIVGNEDVQDTKFPDYNTYNYNHLRFQSFTLEQKTVRYLLNLSNDNISSQTVIQAIDFTSKIKSKFQFLASQYEIMKYVDIANIELDEKILDMLYGDLTTLLEDHTTKTYEATIILICSMFERYCHCWMKSTIGIETDGKALYDFLSNIGSKNMLHTESSYIAFLKLIIKISNHTSKLNTTFNQDSLLEDIIDKFSKLNNFQKYSIFDSLTDLMRFKTSDQIEIYGSLVKSFQTPQKSIESSATFCLFMIKISEGSESLVIASICNLLQLSSFHQVYVYLSHAIKTITSLSHIKDGYHLFWNFKEVFFKCWESFELEISQFPCSLFGFSSLAQFYRKTYKQIAALSLAYNQPDTISNLSKTLSMKESSIVNDSMALSITLSWTAGGGKNKVFKRLEKYFNSSKGLKLNLKEQFVLIVFHLLRYCDCSSEEKLMELLDESMEKREFILRKDSMDIRFLEEYEMYIKPKSCLDMIHYFGDVCGISDIWTIPLVYHMASKILLLIEASVLSLEKLLHIRRLKLLIMISGGAVKESKVCELITKNLVGLLSTSELRTDVSNILAYIIKNTDNPSNISDTMYMLILNALLSNNVDDSTLQIAIELKTIENSSECPHYNQFYQYCLGKLLDENTTDIFDIEGFINYAHEDKATTMIATNCYSSLLNNWIGDIELRKTFQMSDLTTKFIQNLYSIKLRYSEHFSEKMLVWIGICLGEYYTKNGMFPQQEKFEFDSYLLKPNSHNNFDKEVVSLNMVFRSMKEDTSLSSLKTKYCFETIVGVIIYKHQKLNENLTSVFSYDELFSEMEMYIQPMGDYLCSLLIEQVEDDTLVYYKNNLDQALNGFSTNIKVYAFEKWMPQILFSIINELSAQNSIIILLANYICHIPEFAIKCFCPLILYYIQNQPLKRGQYIAKMIQDYFKQDMNTLSHASTELFVELVLLTRLGSKSGNEKFNAIMRYVDIPLVVEAALHIKKFKTALMLFEDYYTNMELIDNATVLNDSKYNQWLKLIYEGLDDKDLNFGLPIVPELEYGVQGLQVNSKWGEMMFSNAIFDSNLRADNPTHSESLKEMSHGMMSMGWFGASNIMSEYSQSLPGSELKKEDDILYEQLWKLNQWDIPVVEVPVNENQCVYSILKNIKNNPDEGNKFCHNAISNLVKLDTNEFNHHLTNGNARLESWMRTLSVVNIVDETISLDGQTFAQNFDKFATDTSWFKDASTEEFENILLSRRVTFEILGNQGSQGNMENSLLNSEFCWMGVVNELHRYTSLMIDDSHRQKAINSAVMLDQISKTIFKHQNEEVNRVAKFNLARAFWIENSDTRFPVETLKNLIISDTTQKRFTKTNDNSHIPRISTNFLLATLSQWCDECKQETSGSIMETYIEQIVKNVEKFPSSSQEPDIGKTFHIMANFCDEQISKNQTDSSFAKLSSSISSLENDISSLTKYIKEEDLSNEKKKFAMHELNRLKIRHKSQSKELQIAKKERETYVTKAVNFYFKSIAHQNHQFIETDIDRFCSLWIEYSDIQLNETELLNLSTSNFVPWSNQLVSRLLDERSTFQHLLKKLVINIAFDHPFHILYLLKSLRMTKEESDDTATLSRGNVANDIWNVLSTSPERFNVEGIQNLLDAVDSFANKAVEIANVKLKNAKKISLSKLPDENWWKMTLPELLLPSPVKNIEVQVNRPYRRAELPIIVRASETIVVASSGVSHPKIMKFLLMNGEVQKMLMKAPDDLRQDSIMKQVFEKVNKLLWKDIETRKRKLRIITYNVMPLGPTSGILEFVPNSMPLVDILKSLHKHDDMDINEARIKMKEIQSQSKSGRYQAYNEICKHIQPCLKDFFFNNFTLPDKWFTSRSLYSHGIATTSITGYILGIGDRHCNNILLDKSSGEPIHIDFGIAFDQGKSLPIPETVPFRLTRDIVDGLGISNVNGMFSKSCEHVLRVLRNNTQYIGGILDVLKYDPLYSWTLSPLRKKKLQQIYFNDDESNVNNGIEEFLKKDLGSEANNAIETVKKKLEAKGLSDEAVVRELIRDAADPKNLALIFMGWSPFL